MNRIIARMITIVDPERANRLVDRGNAHFLCGDFDSAVREHTRAIALKPQFAIAYGARGNANYRKKDYPAALADYDKAIELNPKSAMVYANRSSLKLTMGDPEGALADSCTSLALDGRNPVAHHVLGNLLQSRGDSKGAIAEYDRSIELDPTDPEAYNRRGNAKLALGELQGAIADYTRAIELEPSQAGFYYNRARAKEAMADLQGAHADCDKAVLPVSSDAYAFRAYLRCHMGDWSGAVDDYTNALAIKPDDGHTHFGLAFAKAALGDYEGAESHFSKAAEVDAMAKDAYHFRGCMRYDQRQWSKAMADFRKALELDPRYGYSHIRCWLVRVKLGEAAAATAELEHHLRTGGEPADVWVATIGHFLTGQTTEDALFAAAEQADKTKQCGQRCQANFYVATKMLIAGDPETARSCFEKCLATKAHNYAEYHSAASELQSLRGITSPSRP